MAAACEDGGADRARHLASKRTKGSGLSTPTPPNLKSQDNEPAAVGPAQFGACALFSTSRSEQGSFGSTTPSSAWEAGSSNRGEKLCVDCQLGATPQRQAVVLAIWVYMQALFYH